MNEMKLSGLLSKTHMQLEEYIYGSEVSLTDSVDEDHNAWFVQSDLYLHCPQKAITLHLEAQC